MGLTFGMGGCRQVQRAGKGMEVGGDIATSKRQALVGRQVTSMEQVTQEWFLLLMNNRRAEWPGKSLETKSLHVLGQGLACDVQPGVPDHGLADIQGCIIVCCGALSHVL